MEFGVLRNQGRLVGLKEASSSGIRVATAPALLVFALLAAACGGTATPASKEAPAATANGAASPAESSSGGATAAVKLDADACKLLTAEEVAGALEGTAESTATESGPIRYCRWSTGPMDPAQAGPTYLSVVVNDPTCALLIAEIAHNAFGGSQKRVDGIGQGGQILEEGGNVQIKAKGGCFSIDAQKKGAPVAKATMLQLAKAAAGRV